MKAVLTFLVIVAAVFGIYRFWYLPRMAAPENGDPAIATVVAFGKVLQMVPLSDDVDTIRLAMNDNYKPYVSPELLVEWKDDPKMAPGRLVVSPWPARIDPDAIAANGDGTYTIQGRVIEITSKELVNGGSAHEYVVEVIVEKQDADWRITSFERQ